MKSNKPAAEVCEILGIDNKFVSSVTIQLEANELAVVLVKFILTKEQWNQIGPSEKSTAINMHINTADANSFRVLQRLNRIK